MFSDKTNENWSKIAFNILITVMKGPEKRGEKKSQYQYTKPRYTHMSGTVSPHPKGTVNEKKVYETASKYLRLCLFSSFSKTVVMEVSLMISDLKKSNTFAKYDKIRRKDIE